MVKNFTEFQTFIAKKNSIATKRNQNHQRCIKRLFMEIKLKNNQKCKNRKTKSNFF